MFEGRPYGRAVIFVAKRCSVGVRLRPCIGDLLKRFFFFLWLRHSARRWLNSRAAKPATLPAVVPGFTVTVTYSQKAMATLVAGKETVIVVGYLSGSPIPGTPKKYIDHIGEIDMGEVKSEIAPGATAKFDR